MKEFEWVTIAGSNYECTEMMDICYKILIRNTFYDLNGNPICTSMVVADRAPVNGFMNNKIREILAKWERGE